MYRPEEFRYRYQFNGLAIYVQDVTSRRRPPMKSYMDFQDDIFLSLEIPPELSFLARICFVNKVNIVFSLS